jgi:transcriptional regulator with XRE-family HTH domain
LKLGDVLKKERTNRSLTLSDIAQRLGVTEDEYGAIEAGGSPAELWGPILAQIAIQLETPTSRLLAESGRAADTRPGQAGELIKRHRERRGKTAEELAAALAAEQAEFRQWADGSSAVEKYREIEAGTSPVEKYGPLFLAFAEAIEQPVFNLFYPCGLPFQELDDYP